jgi:PPE family
MGFGDWVSSATNSVVSTVDHLGNTVGHAVGTAVGDGYTFITGNKAGGQQLTNAIDHASDAVFFDGTVAGINPALLRKYFNEGPGTRSYNEAEATLKSLNGKLSDIANSVQKATSAVGQGWQSEAAQAGLQDITSSQTAATTLAQHAATKASAYTGQIQAFNSTKNAMVTVPDNPPPPNNPLLGNPLSAVDGTVHAAAYQAGTKANQQAYSNYQPPTKTHVSTIPQGAATITPGQSDPSPGPTQQSGQGINQPRAYAPTFSSSHYAPMGTGQQPGGARPVSPPTGSNQPGGSPVAQPPYPGSGEPSTGLEGYAAPPLSSGGLTAQGGYDSGSFGPGSGPGAGGGYGSVFAGGSFTGGAAGFAGSGSGYGSASAAAGRGSSLGTGNTTGADGVDDNAMSGRAGAAGARGAAGQGGAGAPGAGGQGRKKEDDKEHKTAVYLITEENGTEVVGELPPALPPGGVIG